MKVRDVMTQGGLATVKPQDRLEFAARIMLARGIRHLPVCKEDGVVLGVLSERDLLAFRGYGGLQAPVQMAMISPVETASPDDDASDAAARMATKKLGCLPVVERGTLVGILTTTDLLAQTLRAPRAERPRGGARVSDAMRAKPEVAHVDEYLLDAIGRMQHLNVRHLPVIDGDERVVGMLSDRDVRTAVGSLLAADGEEGLRRRVREMRVSEVATFGVYEISQDAPLSDAARALVDRRVGALPVVNEAGRLTGILSYVDVLRHLTGLMDQPGAATTPPEASMPVT